MITSFLAPCVMVEYVERAPDGAWLVAAAGHREDEPLPQFIRPKVHPGRYFLGLASRKYLPGDFEQRVFERVLWSETCRWWEYREVRR